jgi:hypothetical protein
MGKRHKRKEYLVTPSARRRKLRVSLVLRQHPGVTILDELDESTALVTMSDRAHHRLAQEHPELTIEPNIMYTLS